MSEPLEPNPHEMTYECDGFKIHVDATCPDFTFSRIVFAVMDAISQPLFISPTGDPDLITWGPTTDKKGWWRA
jgi:hypothetical protein